jgi:hypothetical protein
LTTLLEADEKKSENAKTKHTVHLNGDPAA